MSCMYINLISRKHCINIYTVLFDDVDILSLNYTLMYFLSTGNHLFQNYDTISFISQPFLKRLHNISCIDSIKQHR